MQILTAEIDLQFVALIITILSGIFVLYKSIKHYRLIGSNEYLLLAIVFFNLTFFALFRLWGSYFSFERVWLANQDDRFWNYWLIYFILQTAWGIGIVALLIHIYRLIDWRKRHPILKGILILFFVEGVLEAIYYSVITIMWFTTQDWWYLDLTMPDAFYKTHLWFLQVWFLHFIFQTGQGALNFYLSALYLLVALAYIKIKPIVKTRNIQIARYLWIFFGFGMSIQWFAYLSFVSELQILSSIPFFDEIKNLYLEFYLLEFIETISIVSIMLIVALFPETLLITEYQLIKAVKLYQFMGREEKSKESFSIVNSEQNIVNYVRNLPPELIKDRVM